MKQLYTVFLLIICYSNFAQSDLFIADNSYVYVDGTGFSSSATTASLFVTNDVNISDTGHLYLRNEAQLIQSPSTIASTNTGNGQLSVYQTGTSNTYMYNYWCSPVGINSGGIGNANFRPNLNLYDPIGHASNEHLNKTTALISNFTGGYDGIATIPFTTQQTISSYWLYVFTGTSAPPFEYQDWIGLGGGSLPVGGDPNGLLEPGYGFTMKGNTSAAQKYDFRGKPNNGTILTTLNANRETLVGNPYPSALDALSYIHDTNNATIIDSATLSFWEQNPTGSTSHTLLNYRGGYATYTINTAGTLETYIAATFDSYNLDGTLNTTGASSTSGKTVKRYLPIGQGFMVKGNNTGGTLRTTNAMRIFHKESDGSSEFYKNQTSSKSKANELKYTEDGLFIVPEDYKRFRLNLDFNETYTRQLLQNFHYTATPGEDYGMETRSPEALSSDAYWPQGDKAYNAQAFTFNLNLQIPIVINIDQDQPFRFRIFDVQNFEPNQPIYIHDKNNGVYVDLRLQDYDINLTQGSYTDRFEIVFVKNTLTSNDFLAENFTIIQDNSLSQLTIFNPNELDINTVSIYDVSGKRVLNKRNLSIQKEHHFSTKNISDGVYIVKTTITNQSTFSKKIVIAN